MNEQSYPDFNTTQNGLALLHQRIGQLLHKVLERDMEIAALKQQNAQLTEALHSVQASSAPAEPGG